jgi:tetratricopeptide (TPR) repeat protein
MPSEIVTADRTREVELRVQFAEGWLGLGAPADAQRELESLSDGERSLPAVLSLRWAILAALDQWNAAYQVALEQLDIVPQEVEGWINRSYALRRMNGDRLREAMEGLIEASERFPGEALVFYNLACYRCLFGQEELALELLQTAVSVSNRGEILLMAKRDPDLQPLWGRLDRVLK